MLSSYVKKLLAEDEKIVVHAKPHWILMLRGVVFLVAAMLTRIWGPEWVQNGPVSLRHLQIDHLVIMIFQWMALFYIFNAMLTMWFTHYVLTNHRLLKVTGILRKHLIGVMLSRVETVDVDQSLLGQWLGYGSICIRGTGGSSAVLPLVHGALAFRQKVLKQLDGLNLRSV